MSGKVLEPQWRWAHMHCTPYCYATGVICDDFNKHSVTESLKGANVFRKTLT